MSKHGPITAQPMTWAECAAAGMSKAEACRHRGVSRSAADYPAKRDGLKFADGNKTPENAARMEAMNRANYSRRVGHLTPNQLENYEALMKHGYRSDEAMAIAEGRA